jgi:hypothetical protein
MLSSSKKGPYEDSAAGPLAPSDSEFRALELPLRNAGTLKEI